MERNRFKCERCGWETGNEGFLFCLKCGGDLGRGGIRVECCDRVVVDPVVQKMGFVAFCPYCGKRTGQVSPETRAAQRAERERRWVEQRAREHRVLHPLPLSGVTVQLKKIDRGGLVDAMLRDIDRSLDHLDNRLVIVTERSEEAKEFFEAFKSSTARQSHVEPLVAIGRNPTEEKTRVISGKFQLSKVLFTTVEVLKCLDLQYVNRFFIHLGKLSNDSLKVLGRLASPKNRSRDPVLFDFQIRGESTVQARVEEYENAGATVVNN